MLVARIALVCGLVVSLQPVACYRTNVKQLLDMKNRRSGSTAPNEPVRPLVVTGDNLSPSNESVAKHDDMLDFMQGTPSSKRSVGNMLASVGLMRARLVLRVSSSVMPASLADKVLPAALVQQAPAAEGPEESDFAHLATRGGIFLIVAAAIYMGSTRLLDVVANSKAVGEGGVTPLEVKAAVNEAVKIAVPQVVIGFMYMINELVSTIAVGRVGTKEQLAACGLCQMMMSALLYCFTAGLLSPLDALVAPAWGAGDKDLCMVYVSRARLLGALNAVWLFPIFWFAEPILLAFGQDPAVAVHTVGFCRVLGVAFVPFYFNVSTNWLLKNTGESVVGVWCLLLGNFVHIFLAITLVVHGGWGNLGVAISWACNQLAWKIAQDIYLITASEMKEQGAVRLFLIEPQACRAGLATYIKLAIPSVFAQGSEMWFWEIVTIIIGSMSATALAAHVATANVQTVLMMGSNGLVAAAATVVGSHLGAGNVGLLRTMITIFPIIALTIWSIVSVFLMTFRVDLAKAYCNEADVQETMRTLIIIISVSGYFNCMQAVISGCLKGMARHKAVAYIVLGNFYLLALPLGFILGVKMDFGVYGVYMSFLFGLISMFGCMAYFMASVDLRQEAEQAAARLASKGK